MIVISPAKRLATNINDNTLAPTTPYFKKEADSLAKELALLSSKQLSSLMNVSDGLSLIHI